MSWWQDRLKDIAISALAGAGSGALTGLATSLASKKGTKPATIALGLGALGSSILGTGLNLKAIVDDVKKRKSFLSALGTMILSGLAFSIPHSIAMGLTGKNAIKNILETPPPKQK